MSSRKVQPLTAMKAMRKLLADPEATEEVFVIIRSLAGDAIERGFKRFQSTPHADNILGDPTSLIDVLANRDYLRTLPEGSLGQAYLRFMEEGGITAEGLKEASEVDQVETFENADLEKYALRLRDQHDLWHVCTGFGRDVAGEACLLAFTYAQTKNRGIGFIALMGSLKLRKVFGNRFFSSIWQGYRLGAQAEWLPGQHWETLLPLPLEDVRVRLNIHQPDRYTALSQELLAA